MSTSRDLTSVEEELSDEQVLADIRASLEAPSIPSSIDTRALVLGALERYWADREKGVIDQKGELVDDIAMSFRLASRKLAELQGASFLETALFIVPLVAAALIPFLFPSVLTFVSKVFRDGKSVQILWFSSALLLCLLAFVRQWTRGKLAGAGRSALTYSAPALSGVLLATSWIAATGLQRHQREELSHQREELRHQNERFEVMSLKMAEDPLLKLSLAKIESGNFEKTPDVSQTIPLSDKRTLQLKPKDISPERLVYRAQVEGLPAPIEIKINKHSGAISLVKEDGTPETTSKFYVGKVEKVTDDNLTFTVKNEQGVEESLTFALSSMLVKKPAQGQKVFVAVDSKNNVVTEVVEVGTSQKTLAENTNTNQERPAPGP
jgi:hypothetical protein